MEGAGAQRTGGEPAVAKKDSRQNLERKLAKARRKYEAAQAKYVQAREQGKQEVEKARLVAAQMVATASERLQQRSDKLVRAEALLIGLTGSSPDANTSEGAAMSPDAVADHLERLEHEDFDSSTG
jgi:molecular chaperone GrpE (heat shock protein)